MSHILRRTNNPENPRVIDYDVLQSLQLDDPLPSPAEQADYLTLWTGLNQHSPAERARILKPAISATIGIALTPSAPDSGLDWLVMQSELRPLVELDHTTTAFLNFRLTMAGWERYDAIKRTRVESRTAFMAMKFDAELLRIVDSYFKPAVARTGFKLRLLTDGQPAGLIDDQLRVALRTSRFVIADLTHANNGAYWEAGFTEGLGRPVIYTCRKSEWDKQKSHFDTNHLATIIWDPDNLQGAVSQLAAMIRATLPGEAKMTDETLA